MASLQKAVIEHTLEPELTAHLVDDRHEPTGGGGGNFRNGDGSKTVLTDHSEVALAVPRNRNGRFGLQLVKKRQSRLAGVDVTLIAPETPGPEPVRSGRPLGRRVCRLRFAEPISWVTDAVVEEFQHSLKRPLDPV